VEGPPLSKYKKQERLKGFFHFCVARDWIRTNPVTAIKPVKVPPSPTLPFDEIQMTRILDSCERYPIKGIYKHGNRQRSEGADASAPLFRAPVSVTR
jgi:hypothetical protein